MIIAFAIYLYFSIPDVSYLKDVNPKTTALIEQRVKEALEKGEKPKVYMVWVPLSKISPDLRRAVLIAEDSAFYQHEGFDFEQMKEAIKIDLEKKMFVRGGSTISQQLAKNLFLSGSKNPVRKVKEAIITYMMEKKLSKNRILELYLNLIEWGNGVYGVEAGSQTYFKKSASTLSKEEAAVLAAMIINPRKYTPLVQSKRLKRRTNIIMKRMERQH